jgi:hypothetical protein
VISYRATLDVPRELVQFTAKLLAAERRRLDNSHDEQIRKLLRADLLILDDFCLQPMDATATADIYEIIVERHRTAATVTTSNREPAEWLALMADPLLAQSAIDRLQSAAYELVIDGEYYRHRQNPHSPRGEPAAVTPATADRGGAAPGPPSKMGTRPGPAPGVVPCRWRTSHLP